MTSCLRRYLWKIVVAGERAVAFIGLNIPGIVIDSDLQTAMTDACAAPINPIFKDGCQPGSEYCYVQVDRNKYGHVFACELKNVKLDGAKEVIIDLKKENSGSIEFALLKSPA